MFGEANRSDDARAFCYGCPVVVECFAEGLQLDDTGIRAALSRQQRSKLRKVLACEERDLIAELWADAIIDGYSPTKFATLVALASPTSVESSTTSTPQLPERSGCVALGAT